MSTLRVPLRRRLLLRRAVSAGAVALLVVTLAPSVAQASGCTLDPVPDGSGTAGSSTNPYAVASAADLAKVGVGGCALSAHYRQTADIVLPAPVPPASSNHVPIGTGDPVFTGNPFTGTYDGAGHSITGLTIDALTTPYQGLFSVVSRATLVRIRLVDVSIRGSQHVGGLAGSDLLSSTIEDVRVTGAVAGQMNVGGMLGAGVGSSIIDSIADVDVAAASDGIVPSTARAGGLVGVLSRGDILRSTSSGAVSATASLNATWIGGLVGVLDGRISQSFATGDVTASAGGSASSVGGLVGRAEDSLTRVVLEDVFATGDVEGDNFVGGLVGELVSGEIRIDVDAVLATGAVDAPDGASFVGGLFGDHDSSDSDSIAGAFWDMTSTGQALDNGRAVPGPVQGRMTEDLERFGTFAAAGWAIVDGWVLYDPLAVPVWGICDGVGYPFLLWQFTSDPCGGDVVVSDEPVATTVALAAETAAAAGVAGRSSGVRVRGGESLPVTARVSGAVGPRGGVVLVSDGMEVRVASPLGAREDAGVVVPSSGTFETSVTGALVPDSVIEVWINSQPRLVAAARVPTGGGPVTIGIPTGAPLDGGDPVEDGAHTLELRMFTTDGFEVVATGITVGQVVPASVPAGEGHAPSPIVVGLLVLLGLGSLLARRSGPADRPSRGRAVDVACS